MISLQSLLAGMMDQLLPIAIVVIAALVAVAFFVGFSKGMRRISWKGITWVVACAVFYVLVKVVKLQLNIVVMDINLDNVVFGVASAAVGMLFYGVVSRVFRPRMKWKRLKNFELRNTRNTLEYEADYSEYDSMVTRDYVAISHGIKPGFIGRVLGGLFSIVNMVVVILGLGLAAVTFLGMMGQMSGDMFAIGTDCALIGLIIVLGCSGFDKGYRLGFFGAIRWIFVTFGVLLALGAGAAVGFLNIVKLPENIVTMLEDTLKLTGIYQQIAITLVVFVVMLIVVSLISYILGILMRAMRSGTGGRVFDGCFGALIFTVLFIVSTIALSVLVITVCYILKDQLFKSVEDYLGGCALGKTYLDIAKFIAGKLPF